MVDLLSKVEPKNSKERHVLTFFLNHLKAKTRLYRLFYDQSMQPKGQTLYDSAEDLKNLLCYGIKFKDLDLFEETNLDKEYDVILLSNILDWARTDENKIAEASKTLSKITASSSKVICSTFFPLEKEKEHEIFGENFELEQYNNSNYIYHKR